MHNPKAFKVAMDQYEKLFTSIVKRENTVEKSEELSKWKVMFKML